MITCNCPANAALTTIPTQQCAENFGQIQKVAFVRLYTDSGILNCFESGVDPIDKLTSWTARMADATSEKVVISPYIQAPTVEAGAARTFGGGNETLGGIEIVIGREPTPFTGVMRSVPQEIIKAMKDLQCESLYGNLGVILFDENGNIGALDKAHNGINHYPIPIKSLFIGDKGFGGIEAPDSNAIQWTFVPNYSDDFVIVAPDGFNPLTDLTTNSSSN